MRRRILDWLVCPRCAKDLHVEDAREEADRILAGRLVCEQGHAFAIRAGVPRMTLDAQLDSGDRQAPRPDETRAGQAIAASFGREWSHFDYDKGRTWHADLDERCDLFLREVDCPANSLANKVVFDAGCGNGSLSWGICRHGCEVLAADVSDSVERAYAYYAQRGDEHTHFVQADLMHPPVRPGAFDLVYSSGVLHHNPDTHEALLSIARAIKPGGRIYIWVYHKEPGLKFALQLRLRSMIAPLPAPAKHAFVKAWSTQAILRQSVRRFLGRDGAENRVTWKEKVVDLMDIYTPRYRWMHTRDQVHDWYDQMGLQDIKVTEVRDWGFGTLGTRPG